MAVIKQEDLGVPFTDAARDEGRRLLEAGDVQLMEGSGDESWEARIRFFRRHQNVWIERDAVGAVTHECSCPYLENEGSGCAHLWALLLAVEQEEREAGFGDDGPPPIAPLYVVERHRKHLKLGIWWEGDDETPRLRPLPADGDHLSRVTDTADVAVLAALESVGGGRRNLLDGGGFMEPIGPWSLPPEQRPAVMLAAAATGRLRLASEDGAPTALSLDEGARFDLVIGFAPDMDAQRLKLAGWIVRGGERHALHDCDAIAADRAPVAVVDGRVCPVEAHGAEEWLFLLATDRVFPVAVDETAEVLARLADAGPLPRIALDQDAPPLPLECSAPIARGRITRQHAALALDVSFAYGPIELPPESGQQLMLDIDHGVQRQRDLAREAQVSRTLDDTDGLTVDDGVHGRWFVDPAHLDEVVAELLDMGLEVTAEDRRFRTGATPSVAMKSGIDWFEVDGTVAFGDGGEVPLTRLVEAWRKNKRFVELDDGSKGLVPLAWLEKIGGVLGLGQDVDGRVRFHRAQGALLEPLESEAGIKAPQELATFLGHLKDLADPAPYAPPPGFRGELRPYQEIGVGWMRALATAALGGCLADDMGLGKTVQALAFLLSLETDPIAKTAGPVLVVAPRSLIWNWESETSRFVPGRKLRVHHGPRRVREAAEIGANDWVITTYGTLQRDVDLLGNIEWSVVMLDEAQAIKNPRSKNAAAVRSLGAPVRVALTGTPVENHARDLWSLMAFLDPEMLGTERRFLQRAASAADSAHRALLARTIAPLVLRRTKEQVAPELPPRIEQTVLVTLSDEQQELYEQLREAGARALSAGDLDDGRARMNILEVLLRLRQVACHPGLVDPARAASGKVDLLLDELAQVTGSGHKALVFSQFVKLLDLVAPRLDADGITYARLDGKTSDRQGVVRRFQEDDDCSVMLVSLKAGGHGLNLTAADYVFLLDPWWNPAVEAQAIDRAHRIGRTRKVIACRLVARGTVEERILELQRDKRALADALIGDTRGPLADLTVDDLAMLLR
ncbi:MAG: hypothetical protein CMJ90_02625 [Planctomycetes bacterium]|nr:hypothetical protein [Planctomycetota bacterium]